MISTLAELLKRETDVLAHLDCMKSRVIEDILMEVKKPLPGVTILSESPMCVVVSFSTVFSSPGHCLSAEYYIPESQAKAVADEIRKTRTTADMLKVMRQMIETKGIRIRSGDSAYTMPLNKNTLRVLEKYAV